MARPESAPGRAALRSVRRLFVSLVTAAGPALLLLSLAGCGGDGGVPEVIFAAGQDPSGATRELLAEFNRRHPEMRATYQPMPSSSDVQHDAYVTYLRARDDNIDLYALDVIWTAEFAGAGWLVPLTGWPGEEDFIPAALTSARYGGELYAVPWFSDAAVLYYRRDLLEESGAAPPGTWGELEAAIRRIKRREPGDIPTGTAGFLWQGARYEGLVCNFLEMLWGRGGSLDPRRLAADPAGARRRLAETLGFMRSLVEPGGVSPPGVVTYKEEESRRLFTEGQALFLRNWPYVWSLAQAEGSPVAGLVGIAYLPCLPGERAHSSLGGWNIALSRFSSHPEEARELLAFLTGKEAMKVRALRGGYLPARASVYEEEEVLRVNPHFAQLRVVVEEALNRPSSPQYPRLSDFIQAQVHAVLSGELDPEEAARVLVKELPQFFPESGGSS